MTNFLDYMNIIQSEHVEIYDLMRYFKRQEMDFDEHGNIFIGFDKDHKGLPILVAHRDNVLAGKREPVMDIDGTRIFGKSAGIGWDDKAGIIGILELRKRGLKFRIIFTDEEEVGGISAGKIDPNRLKDAPYILELDRKGDRDVIQTSGVTRLCSDEFAGALEDVGFKRNTGTFTDLNRFKEKLPKMNMANLSIGYYYAHTDDEYLDIEDFENILDMIEMFMKLGKKFEDDKPDEPKEITGNFDRFDGRKFHWGRCECCDQTGMLRYDEVTGMWVCDDCYYGWNEDGDTITEPDDEMSFKTPNGI